VGLNKDFWGLASSFAFIGRHMPTGNSVSIDDQIKSSSSS